MPIAVTAEQLALQASIRDWAERAGPGRSRWSGPAGATAPGRRGAAAGAADGAARRLRAPTARRPAAGTTWPVWASSRSRVPAGAGGAGGTVADLAAALEQVGDALVPGPVLPTLLAGLILARLTGRPAAQELLPALAEGKEPVAVGFSGASLAGAWLPGGGLRVTGEVSAVLGAGSTARLLLGADTGRGEAWFLLGPAPGVTVTARAPLDFSRPLASVRLTGLVIGPEQVLPGLSTAGVRDLAATLCAAEASAVAGWCCGTAAQYARTRHQFGRPIGSFQAVKHLCAGMLCRAERAAVLAWDAARAADEAPAEHPLAAAAAAALALDDAVDNAKDCIQVLGGIGFTWEHDAHLYLRRALALRQLLGSSTRWKARSTSPKVMPAQLAELPPMMARPVTSE